MTTPDRIDTTEKPDAAHLAPDQATLSPGDSREVASRLVDDLELLRAERIVSNQEKENETHRSRSRRRPEPEPADTFNTVTPVVQPEQKKELTAAVRLWNKLRKFPKAVRYFLYMLPAGILLLTPILLAVYAFNGEGPPVGGPGSVTLLWFGIWLEVLWLCFWASRYVTLTMPHIFRYVAKMIGSNNDKKWKDIGRQLEFHTALFLWMLGVLCSFLPIMNGHRDRSTGDWSDGRPHINWISIVNKVIIAFFVLAAMNFVEKILIQWIAASFHRRTYAYRIEQNKLEISYLVQLYEYSKTKFAMDDPMWDGNTAQGTSGTRTPMKMIQANARQAWNQIGNAANKMAGDLTGRKTMDHTHPKKVVMELLRTTPSSHTLARLIYRTFVKPDRETITPEDLQEAFVSPEDAEACFGIFDKDLNGDISMEELELVCNEIHLEKKAIAASLKDLDSVIKKLDNVFVVIILIIAIIIFISIISGSAASALASAGTTILGLSWLLQATAQEFLQSIIFVFVKHPFDVGDRVTVYGNVGSLMRGDDYYVQEISLLYTEFKKMEGHIVQAPNSLLNTLFILNQRRSNGLADPIELKMRFGTPNDLIEELKQRMTDFVLDNKRDYAPRIITEVRTIDEVWSVTMNFIFFHKSSFQNELLRLQRHNKFAAELMRQMALLGIEGPRKMQPGGTKDYPFFWTSVQPPAYDPSTAPGQQLQPPPPPGAAQPPVFQQTVQPPTPQPLVSETIQRRRAESRAQIVDNFPDFGDVYDSRKPELSLSRLESLREAAQVSGISDRMASPIERVRSKGSQESEVRRRGVFGGRQRQRSDSRSPNPGPSSMV
ncbi:Mechanosensitive ion channel protein [Pleurostoma richardsiae]|uniref:Mechanosensitive ion channel protein n=1 Tax=Pleurostoma richardsiae TaxID=41990 RepID=A0AA38RPW0_9PEZI|nr:Mechanosensitive ion channel protein [Pleurostoma richardsiae]